MLSSMIPGEIIEYLDTGKVLAKGVDDEDVMFARPLPRSSTGKARTSSERRSRLTAVRESRPCPGHSSRTLGSGLAPVTQGWFVVNVHDAEWWFLETAGARRAGSRTSTANRPVEFAQLGINVTVLEPGRSCLYHAESNSGGVPRSVRRVHAARRGRGAPPAAVGLLPLSPVDRARLRGRGRRAVRDPDGRRAPDPGGAVPGVGARGALRRERGGGDLRPGQAYATAERFRRERPPYWSVCPGRSRPPPERKVPEESAMSDDRPETKGVTTEDTRNSRPRPRDRGHGRPPAAGCAW